MIIKASKMNPASKVSNKTYNSVQMIKNTKTLNYHEKLSTRCAIGIFFEIPYFKASFKLLQLTEMKANKKN